MVATKQYTTFVAVLKKIFSFLLAVVLLVQVFINAGIGVYYHLNKKYITEKLCENKDKPELNCNGHCYLTKQLKKAEEAEKNAAGNFIKEKDELLSNQIEQLPATYIPFYTVIEFIPSQVSLYLLHQEHSLLKPPIV